MPPVAECTIQKWLFCQTLFMHHIRVCVTCIWAFPPWLPTISACFYWIPLDCSDNISSEWMCPQQIEAIWGKMPPNNLSPSRIKNTNRYIDITDSIFTPTCLEAEQHLLSVLFKKMTLYPCTQMKSITDPTSAPKNSPSCFTIILRSIQPPHLRQFACLTRTSNHTFLRNVERRQGSCAKWFRILSM